MRRHNYLIFLAIPIAFYTGYITSRHTLRHNTQEQIHIRHLRDTIRCLIPLPAETIYRHSYIPVAVTQTDTIYLPRETRIYRDTLFYAEVSGYRPSLDTLAIYPQKTIETHSIYTSTASQNQSARWSLGITAGASLTPQGISPGITVGLSYSFICF